MKVNRLLEILAGMNGDDEIYGVAGEGPGDTVRLSRVVVLLPMQQQGATGAENPREFCICGDDGKDAVRTPVRID